MNITHVFSFLVPPGKNEDILKNISSATVPLEGKLFDMLNSVFLLSEKECDIPIIFNCESKDQVNPVRSMLINLIKSKNIKDGMAIAEKLQKSTTSKSGTGLFFIAIGADEKNTTKVVMSRFPAEVGIMAEDKGKKLEIEYIERIFMKNAKAYKSCMYKGKSLDSDFWKAMAVDKQISNEKNPLSLYWINSFLDSDFETTPKAGTMRLANAIKNAITNAELPEKNEIISATQLLKNLTGKIISPSTFIKKFHLSKKSSELIFENLPTEEAANSTFILDADELQHRLGYKSVEFKKGAIITADINYFDENITHEVVDKSKNIYKYTIEDEVVDERLKGRKN